MEPLRIAALMTVVFLAAGCTSTDTAAPEPSPSRASTADRAASPRGRGVNRPAPAEDRPAPETRVAITDDSGRRTASGRVPAFVAIAGAEVEGKLESLRLTLSLEGPIPERMPDPYTTMRVSFLVVTRDAKRFSFDADGGREGWIPTATGGEGGFPGTFEISGPDAVMTIDPAYMGGLRPFRWLASLSWVRNAPDGTNYGFDTIPKDGFAPYPSA